MEEIGLDRADVAHHSGRPFGIQLFGNFGALFVIHDSNPSAGMEAHKGNLLRRSTGAAADCERCGVQTSPIDRRKQSPGQDRPDHSLCGTHFGIAPVENRTCFCQSAKQQLVFVTLGKYTGIGRKCQKWPIFLAFERIWPLAKFAQIAVAPAVIRRPLN